MNLFRIVIHHQNEVCINYTNVMKKLIFLLIAALAIFTSCSNKTNESNDSLIVSVDSAESAVPSSNDTPGVSDKLRRASIIAQDFVEKALGVDCDFESLNYQGEETLIKDRYKVLQKFTAKVDGQEGEFVYRIYVQYFGGEWSDINNWAYGTLEIENTQTHSTKVFKGDMKEREEARNQVNQNYEIDGVAYKVLFDNGDILQVSSKNELPRNVITKISQKYSGYSSIIFHVDGKTNRGEEYMNVMEELAIDMKNDKMYDVRTWRQL